MAKTIVTLTQYDIQEIVANALGTTPDKVKFVYPPKLDAIADYLTNKHDTQTPFFQARVETDITLYAPSKGDVD